MYDSFYNFKAEPFRLSPDHRFCFTHKSYAKAKAYMQYAIHRAEGFVMVTGKPGTGKTTLVNDLVDGLSHSRMVVATIVSTQLEADDLLRLVSYNFGLDVDAPNKAVVLQGLSVRLKRHHEEGTRALLIIDEAQDLSASALEELRLLTNLQLNNQPLLQIFLVGQENLRDLVQKPSMEQVHQRLVAACHLESLSEEDTKAYVRHRLDRVGWKDDPIIDEGVYPLVFQFSKGVPRRINLVCSRFLLHGSVEEKHRIRASDVRTVVDELQHEQLAPVGFKGQLPPLMDEEEDFDLEPLPESADSVVPPLPESPVGLDDTSGGDQGEQEPESATQTGETLPATGDQEAPVDEDSLRVISLEAEVKREENHPIKKEESSAADTIQQNYFSLDDAMEGPSEPVPIHNPAPQPPGGEGYGDRFANAQQQARRSTTRYYSEYQAAGGGEHGGGRKRSVLGLAFVFILILGVVAAAIYMIRPQILQSEINYIEQQISGYLDTVTAIDRPAGQMDTGPVDPVAGPIPGEEAEADATLKELQPTASRSQPDVESGAAAQGSPLPSTGQELSSGKIQPEPPEVAESRQNEGEMEPLLVSNLPEPSAAKKKVSPVPAEQPVPGATEGSPLRVSQDVLDSTFDPESKQQDEQNGEAILADTLQVSVPPANAVDATEEKDAVPAKSLPGTPAIPEQAFLEQPESASGDPEQSILVEPDQGGDESVSRSPLALQDSTPEPSIPAQKKTPDPTDSTPDRSTFRLFFGSDSSEISSADRQKLDQVVLQLSDYPGAVAHIVGYADSTGDPAYNLSLSFKRARVVADYLRARRVGAERLRVEGRGVYSEADEEDAIRARADESHRLVTVDLLHASE